MNTPFLKTNAEYGKLSQESQNYHKKVLQSDIDERAIKSEVVIAKQKIKLGILNAIASMHPITITLLSLTILIISLWLTYAILHAIYTDIYSLLEWSVRYSIMRNVNQAYALSAMFSAFLLYIMLSILGIKRFFGKLSNHLFRKVVEEEFFDPIEAEIQARQLLISHLKKQLNFSSQIYNLDAEIRSKLPTMEEFKQEIIDILK